MINNIIAQYFKTSPNYVAVPFGSGHIHDTYRVSLKAADAPEYLLQKINKTVFPEPEKLMENIAITTEFLKISAPDSRHLSVVTTLAGDSFFIDEEGEYWRMYPFFKELEAHDLPADDPSVALQQIESAARAFGQFVVNLRALSVEKIHPVLPDFHRVTWRLEQLQAAIQKDSVGRLASVEREVSLVKKLIPKMTLLDGWLDLEMIPVRVTHNDTKFNNVLFDKNMEAKVVIDLDTIMPGCVHYDYGDGLRTAAVTAAEDDVENMTVDWGRYDAFHTGYLSATQEFLTPYELETLPLAAPTLAYIMGVRFLTDYLMGDIYYKINGPTQNLRRARAQLKLAELFLLKPGA